MINTSIRKYSDKTRWDTVYKLQYAIKIHNYNTRVTNIDKTGESAKVPKDRAIEATEPGPLSDLR